MDNPTFAAMIRATGLTRKQLSDALGVSQMAIYRAVTGRTKRIDSTTADRLRALTPDPTAAAS